MLATCEANRLDYVNDPTNFQPALTLRNAIRETLSDKVCTIISRYYSSLRSIITYPPLTQHTPIQVLVPAPAPWSFTVPRLLISTRLLEYAAPKTPAFSHRLATAVAGYKVATLRKVWGLHCMHKYTQTSRAHKHKDRPILQ